MGCDFVVDTVDNDRLCKPNAAQDVALAERIGLEMVHVAAWPASIETVRTILADLFSVPPSQQSNMTSAGGDMRMLWTGPGRWLIVRPAGNRQLVSYLEARLHTDIASVVEVGAGRRVFAVSGRRCRDVLAKYLPVDLCESRFPVGRCVQSVMGHINVLVLAAHEDSFEVFVQRSFSQHLWEMLIDAAREYCSANANAEA
jgi:heterotetrameric sarcosine oxidase gamma subunit